MTRAIALSLLAFLATPNAAKAQSSNGQLDQGSQREIEWMRVVVQKLTSLLIDPASARVSLPYGFTPTPTTWKVWGVPMTGYFTCGTVNSRNRFGGYAGEAIFLAHIAMNGEVNTTLDSDKTPHLARVCGSGGLPPIRQTTVTSIFKANN